jgi:hypothetical protein
MLAILTSRGPQHDIPPPQTTANACTLMKKGIPPEEKMLCPSFDHCAVLIP